MTVDYAIHEFTFSVTYRDVDDDAPSHIYLMVDGSPNSMHWVGGENLTGAEYEWRGNLSPGVHLLSIECSDGNGATVSTVGEGIEIPTAPRDVDMWIAATSAAAASLAALSFLLAFKLRNSRDRMSQIESKLASLRRAKRTRVVRRKPSQRP